MSLRPIAEAPIDLPVLGYYGNRPDPLKRYIVIYYDQKAYLWRTLHGRDFVGLPTHFQELDFTAPEMPNN